jgi:hypothetical protein
VGGVHARRNPVSRRVQHGADGRSSPN